MSAIETQGLTKVYRTYKKAPGLWGAIKGLGHREYEEGRANEDGADRGAPPLAARAFSRRADDRSGCHEPEKSAGVPPALQRRTSRGDDAHEPLHAGRGGALPSGDHHRQRAPLFRWAAE